MHYVYLLYMTYERCRSPQGVPKLLLPLAGLNEEVGFVIEHAVRVLQQQAEQAHAGAPAMQMPTTCGSGYYLGSRAGQRYHDLAGLPWAYNVADMSQRVARVVLYDAVPVG